MKAIIGHLQEYLRSLDRTIFLLTTCFVAVLITLNYTLRIEPRLFNLPGYGWQFAGFFLLFAFTYTVAWLIQGMVKKESAVTDRFFYLLLLMGPLIFAGKITLDWASELAASPLKYPWDLYWNKILNWPLKCLAVLVPVVALWKWGRYPLPVAGMQLNGFPVKPYLWLLLAMVPLIVFAATQPDFLRAYPKVSRIAFIDEHVQNTFWYKLLYEICYGIDFITIEFFFRGFLVLALARYAGKDAILPMAAFYCSIHFGKPLFECITSYFGGIILGVVVFQTRSIWGGLIVHLGIAWLMELAGYLAHLSQE